MPYEPVLKHRPGPEGETERPCRYCGLHHTTRAHRMKVWKEKDKD